MRTERSCEHNAAHPKRFAILCLVYCIGILLYSTSAFSYCSPQCLEYVQSQTDIGAPYGDANGAWADAPGNNGWYRVFKDSGEVPSIGDVLYWDIEPYGHVAMIRGVDGNTVYIDDRNWDLNCGARKNVPVSLDDPNVVGWLTNKPKPKSYEFFQVYKEGTNFLGKDITVDIAWYPADKSCYYADMWCVDGECDMKFDRNSCLQAYSDLKSIYESSWLEEFDEDKWYKIFFSPGRLKEENTKKVCQQ